MSEYIKKVFSILLLSLCLFFARYVITAFHSAIDFNLDYLTVTSELQSYYPVQLFFIISFIILLFSLLLFSLYSYKMSYRQKLLLEEKNYHLQKVIADLRSANTERDNYRHMAGTDGLTGLANKVRFDELCRHEFKNMSKEHPLCALMIVDLDHFKDLNDTCGHLMGDEALKNFALILKNLVRNKDYLGRFGGDEFVIFLNNIQDKAVAIYVAKSINYAATKLIDSKLQVKLSASIGIVFVPESALSYEEAFKCADQAVYTVKRHGRNNYNIYQKN